MNKEKTVINTDVLVVGGGMAGGVAAIKARDLGLDVTLVDKGVPGRSGAASFAGGYYAIFNPAWGHDRETWLNFMNRTGEYVNDRKWCSVFLDESMERQKDLSDWGVEFAKKDGELAAEVLGTWESRMMFRGKFMFAIIQKCIDVGVRIVERVFITDLVTENGSVVGAVGFHTRSGRLFDIRAGATVMAAGSGIFKQPGYPTHGTNDGHCMLYRAGCELTNKEFAMIGGSTFASCPAWRGHGAMASFMREYVNGEGTRLDSELTFHHPALEVHEGRGPLLWNLDNVSEERIKGGLYHQQITGTYQEAARVNFDVTRRGQIPLLAGNWIGATIMGGSGGAWPAGEDCSTNLRGLFAAGECCSTRASGGNYPGPGLGLAGASITGARAGVAAAEYAGTRKGARQHNVDISAAEERVYGPLNRKGGFTPRWLTEVLKNTMIPYYVLLVKEQTRLETASSTIQFLANHLVPKAKAQDVHELRLCHELENMTLNALLILKASLFRTESRGTHYREDFPNRNDTEWLAWVKVCKSDSGPTLWKTPIPTEWRPSDAQSYAEKYPLAFPNETARANAAQS